MNRLETALKRRIEVVNDFNRLCEEARTSPAPMSAFVANRIAYDKVNEEIYEALWYSIADTGVQILRAAGDIRDIDTKPVPKK